MAGRFSVEAVFKAIDKVTAPVTKMQNRVLKFTRNAGKGLKSLNRSLGKFTSGLKKAAVVGVAAGAIFAAAGTNILAAGADFEQAITNVGAVSMQTRAQIKPLESLALRLGKTTKFTSTQAAEAMEVMARAGFKATEIMAATPAVLNAAAASGLEIAEVANHVSNALKGMGMEASRASEVADVLALASSKTNSSIGSLGESLSNVTSTARDLKIPFKEVVASVALLQDVGLDASVAGSAFNTMLTKMAAPTAGITKKMKQFGITFKDAKGNMLPLQKVLQNLSIASKKAGGNFDKVAFLAELVGLRGQKAASNLATLFETGKLKELVKQLGNAEGAAKKMADIRMDTVRGSMLLLESAVDSVKVSIFNMNSGPLKDVIDNMTKWVGENEKLIASNVGEFFAMIINNLDTIVTWMQRIGIAIAVFFTFMAVLKTLIAILTVVNLVMAANPIVLITLGVIALVAAFVLLISWIDEISESFDNLSPIMQAILWPLGLIIKAIKFIKSGIGIVSSAASSISDFVTGSEDEEEAQARAEAQIVSPQERVARSIEERRETSSAELTIKDQTNRAEVTQGKLNSSIRLQASGAF